VSNVQSPHWLIDPLNTLITHIDIRPAPITGKPIPIFALNKSF